MTQKTRQVGTRVFLVTDRERDARAVLEQTIEERHKLT
jgi:hypothetical protein